MPIVNYLPNFTNSTADSTSTVILNSSFANLDVNEVNMRLENLRKRSQYPIVQLNGQRRYGPPPDWQGDEPPRGCEVFIGKLPRNMIEDEIIPIFESIGKLYKFRLMMDFSGTNRGFAFATYTNKADARRAAAELDNYEIRRGRHIGVVISVDNCRLYLGRLPRNKTCEEVRQEICKLTEGVVRVILYPNADDRTKNRGFAFVEYKSHQAATAARRKLIPGEVTMWGTPIEVDWAEPEQEPDEDIIAKVKNLYVRNLVAETTEAGIKRFFENITGPQSVEHVKKLKDFAFVHFKTKENAVLALSKANGLKLDGADIEVVWAKPVDKAQRQLHNIQQQMSAFCATNNGALNAPQQSHVGLLHANPYCLSLPIHLPLNTLNPGFVVNDGGFPTAPFMANSGAHTPTAPSFLLTPPSPAMSTATALITSSSASPPVTLNSTAHMSGTSPGIVMNGGGKSVRSSPSMSSIISNASQYVGYPFIVDSSAGGNSNLVPSSLSTSLSGSGSSLLRSLNARTRGAAGMRSAGYQTNMSSTNRKAGRKTLDEPLLIPGGFNTIACPTNLVFVPAASPLTPLASAPSFTNIFNGPMFWKASESAQTQHTDHNGSLSGSVETQSSNLSSVPLKHATQMLQDYCRERNWSNPQYQETITSSKDAVGRDMPMYVCKVTIKELIQRYGHFEMLQPMPDPGEARETAAYFVLLQLGYRFPSQGAQTIAAIDKCYAYPQIVHPLPMVPYLLRSDLPGFCTHLNAVNTSIYQTASNFLDNSTQTNQQQQPVAGQIKFVSTEQFSQKLQE